MTKWLQDLMLLHRIVAVIHFLQGLFMLFGGKFIACLLYTSPSPRDRQKSRMPSSA